MGRLIVTILFESVLIYFFLMGARRVFKPETHQSSIEKEFVNVLGRLLGRQPKWPNNPSRMVGLLNIGCAIILAIFILVDLIIFVRLLTGFGGS